MASRFSTADLFLMLSCPMNASSLRRAALIHVGGRSVIATTSRAMSCMACNPDVKLFGLRLESPVALVASVSASGSSIHGCRTSFGFSSLMISPDLPVRPSVANPLM